jgi:hypothetical protein
VALVTGGRRSDSVHRPRSHTFVSCRPNNPTELPVRTDDKCRQTEKSSRQDRSSISRRRRFALTDGPIFNWELHERP